MTKVRKILRAGAIWAALTTVFAIALISVQLLFSYGTVSPCSIAKQLTMRQINQNLERDRTLKNSLLGLAAVSAASNMADATLAGNSPLECAQIAVRLSLDEQQQ